MTKITLEFDSIEEAQDVLNGSKWKGIVWDLDQFLRKTTKYNSSIFPQKEVADNLEVEIADRYREVLRELMTDHGLKLD